MAKIFAGYSESSSVIKITGHATWQESDVLRRHGETNLETVLSSPNLTFNLSECSYVDSTILGILASLAVKYLKANSKKALIIYTQKKIQDILMRANCQYVFEMLQVRQNDMKSDITGFEELPAGADPDKAALRRNILLAHETLMELNEENVKKFSKVVRDLKKK